MLGDSTVTQPLTVGECINSYHPSLRLRSLLNSPKEDRSYTSYTTYRSYSPFCLLPIHESLPMSHFLSKHGNYKDLLSYENAEIIYDLTFRFCSAFLQKFDRTNDQMIQAARSGKQNIAEGSKAALTSKETELKLTNVARASLEELLVDYQDFLRVRDLKLWPKDSKEALFVRALGNQSPTTYETYRPYVESRSAEVVANIAICLIHQTNFLLNQQLRNLEQDFLQNGGIRERMTKARIQVRNQQSQNSSPTTKPNQ